jgi:tRNA G18 (ribose-2'-O)-methylase SpoU
MEIIKKLQKEGVRIIALEQDNRSVDFRSDTLPQDEDVCIVLGNEIE